MLERQVGNVDADGRKLVRCAFECLQACCAALCRVLNSRRQAALALVRPGTLYRDVGPVIHARARQDGCSVVKTYCGHGIGRLCQPDEMCEPDGHRSTVPHSTKRASLQ